MAYNGHNDGYNSHGMQDLSQNPSGVRHKLLPLLLINLLPSQHIPPRSLP